MALFKAEANVFRGGDVNVNIALPNKSTRRNKKSKMMVESNISHGRYIKLSVDGYFENFEFFPHSTLIIPINDEFNLKTSVKDSIHDDFIEFLKDNNTCVKDVQAKLDRSLGCDARNREPFPGAVGYIQG